MAHSRAPAIFLSHGGGPLPVLGDPGHAVMIEFLKHWPATLAARPKAIIVVSAHWEEASPVVAAGSHPELIYDYAGFPPESYKLKYPAAGDPALAARAVAMLQQAGHPAAALSPGRGWDHGVFIPMMLAFPEADVPIVQLSLVKGFDPAMHWDIGRALRPLRDEGVLIVGSGSSYHNMMGFFGRMPNVTVASAAFDAYITAAVNADDDASAPRRAKLLAWEQAPHARDCHPPRAEEHLVPLFVAAGAAHADEAGRRVYGDANFMGGGITMSAWQFG